MQKRKWIRSGIVEELDAKQIRLMNLVLEKIKFYYRELYRTRDCFKYALSLSRLCRLTKRNSYEVLNALKWLSHTIPEDSDDEPQVYYDRIQAEKNKSHRPYRIFLRKKLAI